MGLVQKGWCFMDRDGSEQAGYICHSFYVDVVRVQVLFLYIDKWIKLNILPLAVKLYC